MGNERFVIYISILPYLIGSIEILLANGEAGNKRYSFEYIHIDICAE